ncbi:unnamed protein product, partial [Closterium sp. Naga37s-1]
LSLAFSRHASPLVFPLYPIAPRVAPAHTPPRPRPAAWVGECEETDGRLSLGGVQCSNKVGSYSPPPATWVGACEETDDFPVTACSNKVVGARWFIAGMQKESKGQVEMFGDYLSPRDAQGHGTWCAGCVREGGVWGSGEGGGVEGGGGEGGRGKWGRCVKGMWGVGATAGAAGVPLGDTGETASGMALCARIAAYKVFWRSRGQVWATEADIAAAVNSLHSTYPTCLHFPFNPSPLTPLLPFPPIPFPPPNLAPPQPPPFLPFTPHRAAAGAAGVPLGDTGETASGMAPRARIAAYKVFWRSRGQVWATEADIAAAVNAAVADGVD